MNKLPLKIEQCNEKITPFGGTVLVADLINQLGISNYLDQHLPSPCSNRGTMPSTKVIPVIMSLLCGGSSFSDIDKLSNDKALKRIWGFENILDSSTINRWFIDNGKTAGDIACGKSIAEIGILSQNIAIKGLHQEGISEVTLDQDATFNEVYKTDAKYCYKKFKAFSSMMCFVDGMGYCIDEEFRNGNVSPQSGILSQLKRVQKRLEFKGIKISNLRNDSAGYQSSLFNYCSAEGITFYIGGDLDSSVMGGIASIEDNEWTAFIDRHGTKSDNEEVAEFIHCMNSTDESFRMIVIRENIQSEIANVPELLGDRYKYRVIATNSKLEANKAILFYNKRGTCEYYIKEAKYGFSLKHLPSGGLGANGLWFKTGILAYNLLLFLKRIILKGEYKNKEAKSIRYLLFSIAGKLVTHSRRTILKLCCSASMIRQIKEWRSVCMNL